MVTKAGELYLFGKDSSQCDWSGHVIELKGHQTIQAAMGKAHVVVLTKDGDVYTFGMNNKGIIIVHVQNITFREILFHVKKTVCYNCLF